MKHEQVKCNQQYTQLRMQNILSITFLDSLLFSVSFAASFSHFVLVASVRVRSRAQQFRFYRNERRIQEESSANKKRESHSNDNVWND